MINPLIPDSVERLRKNNFDALRLGMALLVVWSHCFALWFGSEDDEPISLLLGGIYNSGNIAVLGFFTISGFLITQSYARSPSAWRYMKKRIARIYPGYLVAVLLCSLVVVPAFSSRAFGDISGGEWLGLSSNLLLRNYIISSDAFGGGPVNGALWSIPYEFWCYIGILALGIVGLIGRRPLFPLIAIAVMLVRVWLDLTGRVPGGGIIEQIIGFPYLWFAVLPSFMLGATVHHYRSVIPRSHILLLILLALTIISSHLPFAIVSTRLLLPPTLAYGIFYLAFTQRISFSAAAKYGDFSYGAYLYAFPIQQMLAHTLKGVAGFPVYVGTALILSLMAGVMSWYAVERWFSPTARRDHPEHHPALQEKLAPKMT